MVIKPFDLMQKSLNKKVTIRTKDGREFTGKLTSFDDSLNLVLEDAEEVADKGRKDRGTMVIKGGNIVYMNKA
ncbi:MAG: LSM domain-containing protein [Candidatus Hydrothermarchaeales archaeon]